ncbi:MAG TPA: translation initiation factor IF-2 [Pseudomonadales bacterium]|nr:translation initiation factor IF-2 [Pseudomonadales bacterium]
MSDVIVSQLAESIGTSVDRLLKQMEDAGLPQRKPAESVSDEQKEILLRFLRESHGAGNDADGGTKKITLKRKTVSTLKAGVGAAKKTVSVEVRKKRTYVKRDIGDTPVEDESVAPDVEAEISVAGAVDNQIPVTDEPHDIVQSIDVVEDTVAVVDEVLPPVAETVPEEEIQPEVVSAAKPVSKLSGKILGRSALDDAEQRRQTAILARRAAEEVERAEIARKKKDLEKERQSKVVPAVAVPGENSPVAEQQETSVARTDAPKKRSKQEEEDEKTKKKGAVKVREKAARAKPSRNDVFEIIDEEDVERHSEDMDFRPFSRGAGKHKVKVSNKHTFQRPTEKQVLEVALPEEIQVGELAQKMNVKGVQVVKALMKLGVMATISEIIDRDTATLIVEEFGHSAVSVSENAVEEDLEAMLAVDEGTALPRAPVVTVMGHVDHGKTSLLDYIRKAKVAAGEAGGITQHIGAYRVQTERGVITFLDTPGHAAFTAMRSRGAQSTDVVILVVAADDGVMPQTIEAIQHAKAAGVPIVVAINKIDKPAADLERVKNELVQRDVIPDDWGGDTQFIPVSAHTGEGIDRLLEAVLLQAEMLELKAPSDIPAQGVVIESRLDKGRGAVASLLVQRGTLRRGDIVLAGINYGRVKAMFDHTGQPIDQAGPSVPVELLGLDGVPNAGDGFMVVPDERRAREVAQFREQKQRLSRHGRQQTVNLENIFSNIGADEKKILNVVLKADVRGSLEAIQFALAALGNDEVEVRVISGGVGGIAETDVNLAATTGAIILGFNVRAEGAARKRAEQEGLEIRYYSIIYNLLDEMKQALGGMLAPETREEIVGIAQVRDVFSSPKFGQIAGCMVTEGTVYRNKPIRVLRDNVVIFQGHLESLRRFKDDASEVRAGMECGIGVKDYTDVKPGDQIEVYQVSTIARTL